jgi:phosphoglycerate dehydrogenase-like enzyme
MRIAVLDDYQRCAHQWADWASLPAEVSFFSEPIPRGQLADTLRDFDALVLMRERTAFPREVLERLPALKLLVTTGMSNASVDLAYLRERGVTVCGTGIAPSGPSSGRAGPTGARGVPTTVEVAWALILAVTKRVRIEDRALRAGQWQLGLPTNLAGATLGLAGLGRLGGAMVGPARAFGMEVIAWSQNLTAERAGELAVPRVSRDELLGRADIISIHLVLSARTRGLLGAPELARMKSTAVLINTSRGPIVDERALIAALRDGTLAAAGLDVYDREPLPPDHELLALDNVVLLPHLGYVSEPGMRSMYGQAVEDIAAFLRGSPIRVID